MVLNKVPALPRRPDGRLHAVARRISKRSFQAVFHGAKFTRPDKALWAKVNGWARTRWLASAFPKNFIARPVGRAMNFLRGLYRLWADARPAPLLMGLFFLLEQKSSEQMDSFQGRHPFDRKIKVKEGMEVKLYERNLSLENSGAVLSVIEGNLYIRQGRAFAEIWLQEEAAEPRRLAEAFTRELSPGSIFSLGAKPKFWSRGGFDPAWTQIYRVEKAAEPGLWLVRELAHLEAKLEDYQLDWLVQHVKCTREDAEAILECFLPQVTAMGWTLEERADFLGRNLVQATGLDGEPIQGMIHLPAYTYALPGLFVELRLNWGTRNSLELMQSLTEDGPVFQARGFHPMEAFQTLESMRQMGFSIAEISRWVKPLFREMRDIDGALMQFASALKFLVDSRMEKSEAASLLSETILAFQHRDELSDLDQAVRILAEEMKLVPSQALPLMKAILQAFERDDGSEGRMQANRDKNFRRSWSALIRHYVSDLASFDRFLATFRVSPEMRIDFMTDLIEVEGIGAFNRFKSFKSQPYAPLVLQSVAGMRGYLKSVRDGVWGN